MFDLFRFINVRPPQEIEDDRIIPSDTGSPFQNELLVADSLGRAKRTAWEYARSNRFVRGWDDLQRGNALRSVWGKLAAIEAPTVQNVTEIVTEDFDAAPAALVGQDGYRSDRERAADSLVASKLTSRGTLARLPELVAAVRLFALIEGVARGDAWLGRPGAVKRALARMVRLPHRLEVGRPAPDRPKVPPPVEPPKDDPTRKNLEDKLDTLDRTVLVLSRIPSDDFAGTPVKCARPASADDVRDEVIQRLQAAIGPDAPILKSMESGGRAPVPQRPEVSPLALGRPAADRLPADVKKVLADRGIDITKTSLPQAVARLETEIEDTGRALAKMQTMKKSKVVGLAGRVVVQPDLGGFLGVSPGPKPEVDPAFLTNLRPSGTADLLVVKQQIKRYEAGEIGHIANILQGESNEHTVRRARTVEETQLREVERIEEEERDLQSTEHFELKSEVERTVKDDASLKAGASLSGSYGGMIDFKTYVDGSISTSKEESTKQSSAYAKDVTTRAATRVSERVREVITRRTVEEFEDTTKHGFDNEDGDGHVVGIYQWVDKIYEAQVWNYGMRLLFDLMVPEPAAFFIEALAQQKAEGESLEKPAPFTLNASQITTTNYHTYVALYGATGIDAPPAMYRTVAKTFDERSDNSNPKTKSAEVGLERGYRAISAVVLHSIAYRDSDFWRGSSDIDVMVGDRHFDYGYTSLSNEEGQIPVGFFGYKVSDFVVTYEITTQRTDTLLDEWRVKTHAAIQAAYLKQLSDYEQKLANLKAQVLSLQGHNPGRNRTIEKNELKRGALALFTQRLYESFDGIDETSPGGGQPDLITADALGRFVRFFEQAFEWEQVMYVFYPYFWGRSTTWGQRLLLDDPDPQFADFLQAGWARVTVPVRPFFERAVAHYIETGEIWLGGDVPQINSPLYVSVLTEIEERLDRPGEEIPQGDPWEVRLPTTLVRLRADATLPSWRKEPDGRWVPEN